MRAPKKYKTKTLSQPDTVDVVFIDETRLTPEEEIISLPAAKSLVIKESPKVLIVTMKRFGNALVKDTTPCLFPPIFDLAMFLTKL